MNFTPYSKGGNIKEAEGGGDETKIDYFNRYQRVSLSYIHPIFISEAEVRILTKITAKIYILPIAYHHLSG